MLRLTLILLLMLSPVLSHGEIDDGHVEETISDTTTYQTRSSSLIYWVSGTILILGLIGGYFIFGKRNQAL